MERSILHKTEIKCHIFSISSCRWLREKSNTLPRTCGWYCVLKESFVVQYESAKGNRSIIIVLGTSRGKKGESVGYHYFSLPSYCFTILHKDIVPVLRTSYAKQISIELLKTKPMLLILLEWSCFVRLSLFLWKVFYK